MAKPRNPGRQRLERWLRNSTLPTFLLDESLGFAQGNPAWESLVGRGPDEIAGLICSADTTAEPGSLAELAASMAPPPEALGGQVAAVRSRLPTSRGYRWAHLVFWPFLDQSSRLMGVLGSISLDVETNVPEAESRRLRSELLAHRESLQKRFGFDHLIGTGDPFRRQLDQIQVATETDRTVLIQGEPGTGKRLVARTIHQWGRRAGAPLIPFDCSALPPEVLQRELFRHELEPDGGFPGFSAPAGSTVLLAHVTQLPRDLQARFVSALEGPVRVLATSEDDPEKARDDDRWRPDFYFALTTLVIRLRPLRESPDHLPLLAEHFLQQVNLRSSPPATHWSPAALRALATYDWPGNHRELARVVEQAQANAAGGAIETQHIPAEILGHFASSHRPPNPAPAVPPLDPTLELVERRMIERALRSTRQNKSRAADLLGISRPRLHRRMQELGMAEAPEAPQEPTPPASESPPEVG